MTCLRCDINALITDINECLENVSGCPHDCKNTIGGFSCSCKSGFVLGKDSKSCTGKAIVVWLINFLNY